MRHNRPDVDQPRILHPLVRAMHELETALSAEIEMPPYEDDPEWLRTPIRRRAKALLRLAAIMEYEDIARERNPGAAEVSRLADGIGASQRQFYQLLDSWGRERTIFSLIPWAGRQHAHNQKLDEAVRINMIDGVNAAIAQPDARTPRAILAAVLSDWPKDGTSPPSEQTIRSYIADTVGAAVGRAAPFSVNGGGPGEQMFETASRPGEVVVIDYVAPELFICREGAEDDLDDEDATRPTLGLAIDLHSQVPVGFAISRDPPSADMVRDILRDVEDRTQYGYALGLGKHTKVMLTITGGKPWRALVADLAAAEVKANVRWSPRLHFGGPARRLIGTKLGRVPISGRKLHKADGGRGELDHGRHALMTIDQARIVIEDAMRAAMEAKLGRTDFGPSLHFGL